MLCPQEDYSCLWLVTPTLGDDQNRLMYQLQIQPLPDEAEEPGEEEYHTLEHTFDISNMKVKGGEKREREERERERGREVGEEGRRESWGGGDFVAPTISICTLCITFTHTNTSTQHTHTHTIS